MAIKTRMLFGVHIITHAGNEERSGRGFRLQIRRVNMTLGRFFVLLTGVIPGRMRQ
jgi:hypothetical protein